MNRALTICALAIVTFLSTGCPTNTLRVLIVNDTDFTVDGIASDMVVYDLQETVPPHSAKYVMIPQAARGGSVFGLLLDNNSSFSNTSTTLQIGVNGLDVVCVASGSFHWLKLTE